MNQEDVSRPGRAPVNSRPSLAAGRQERGSRGRDGGRYRQNSSGSVS